MGKINRFVWISWLREYAERIGAGFLTVKKDGMFIHIVHVDGDAVVRVFEPQQNLLEGGGGRKFWCNGGWKQSEEKNQKEVRNVL